MSQIDGGGAAMVAAKKCQKKGSTPACREVMTWLNKLASASEPRGEPAPFPRHIHNMKGGPLNVMEVAGTM